MAWTLEYNTTLSIIEIVFAGKITASDLEELTTKRIKMCKEKDILEVLIDATEQELAASLFDIFQLPDKQYFSEGMDRKTRVALVMPKSPKSLEAAQFYETACVNRGWDVKLLPHRDEAIEWLKATNTSALRSGTLN